MKMDLIDKFRGVDDKQIKQAKEELATSFNSITGTMAFRHIMSEMDRIYQETFQAEDVCDLMVLAETAAESRGMRKAIGLLKRRIESAVKGI